MRQLSNYMTEKLDLTLPVETKHTLFPKTKDELRRMIYSEIDKKGLECSLNHIDVSKIDNMSYLFADSKFNGNISDWDVSGVINMESMFQDSEFNKDISDWDVSSVTNMRYMFTQSKFNKDISDWDVSSVTNMRYMFAHSKFNKDISQWQLNDVCKELLNHRGIFLNCPIKMQLKPKF